MLTSVGERAAVVARSTVQWSVDGCLSTRSAAARNCTSTTAADNQRHRTVVFRQAQCSGEVRGHRRPAGDDADERECISTCSSNTHLAIDVCLTSTLIGELCPSVCLSRASI